MGIGLAVVCFTILGMDRNGIITLQKLYVNYKIDAEEAKIADITKVTLVLIYINLIVVYNNQILD